MIDRTPQNGRDDQTNIHHCVPRSFLGSSDSINLSRVYQQREHNPFHAFAGYRPPDFLLRKKALSSIHWHDESGHFIAAGFYHDLLDTLMISDWRDLYDKKAIRRDTEGNGHSKTAIHLQLHVWEEQKLVADAVASLAMGTFISPETRQFTNRSMEFFSVNTPVSAMYNYLVDTNAKGERKWVKPLQPDVHSELCTLTRKARIEMMTRSSREQLMIRLMQHQHDLVESARDWRPSLHDSFGAIVDYGQSRMDERMAKRKAITELR